MLTLFVHQSNIKQMPCEPVHWTCVVEEKNHPQSLAWDGWKDNLNQWIEINQMIILDNKGEHLII